MKYASMKRAKMEQVNISILQFFIELQVSRHNVSSMM